MAVPSGGISGISSASVHALKYRTTYGDYNVRRILISIKIFSIIRVLGGSANILIAYYSLFALFSHSHTSPKAPFPNGSFISLSYVSKKNLAYFERCITIGYVNKRCIFVDKSNYFNLSRIHSGLLKSWISYSCKMMFNYFNSCTYY